MKWKFNKETCNKLDFNSDILGSEIFYLIKKNFVLKIKSSIPKIIINHKKNKERILDNLFCHWYFWEAYISNNDNYHPLLLENDFSFKSLKNILYDYYKNDEKCEDVDKIIDKIISELDLKKKIEHGILYLKKYNIDTDEDNQKYNCSYTITTKQNLIKISIKTDIDNYILYFSKTRSEKILKKLDINDFVRLIFRYYVLGSNNNQLATNPDKLNDIKPDIELFASGFNNHCTNFCSIFPDLEKNLGSLGRFQDIELISGVYHINPPFQTTMIYDIFEKIKIWIDKANINKKKLEFHLFLPNWLKSTNELKYSKYKVIEMANDIKGKSVINNIKNIDFDYIDYWNNKVKNFTLPDTLYIKINN